MMQKMKLALVTILLFSLCGCKNIYSVNRFNLSPTSVPGQTSDYTKVAALQSYKAVMLNKAKLTQKPYAGSYDEGASNQPFYLNQLIEYIGIDESWNPFLSKFTIIDLDNDSIPEVVIQIDSSSDGWYEVLHYYNGTVYGYYFVYRAMESLKNDGTFIGSSGAADNDLLKISFSGNTLNQIRLAYSKSEFNENETVKYYIADKPVSESEFNALMKNQNLKSDVTWYDFNNSNINKYFS